MKKNDPARRASEKNNLAPILSEKNILARTKNPSPPPPLNIKWTVPKSIPFMMIYQYQYNVQPYRLNYETIGTCLRKGLCISMTNCEGTTKG